VSARDKLQACERVKSDGVGNGLANIEDRDVHASFLQE
jgi:hypothetical protein